MEALIGPILSAAGSVIAKVVELASQGKRKEAELMVKRFKAATDVELADDRAEAEDILARRFPDSQPPEE